MFVEFFDENLLAIKNGIIIGALNVLLKFHIKINTFYNFGSIGKKLNKGTFQCCIIDVDLPEAVIHLLV